MTSNELIQRSQQLPGLIEEKGIGDILKPLTREIHLFDTYIAGTSHIKDPAVFAGAKPGDKLTLRREDNKFDEKAILLLNEKGEKLSYVPERDNVIFSRLMDAGKLLSATIRSIQQKGTFFEIGISIYLIDF